MNWLRPPNWPRSTRSVGRSRPRSTNSRPICAARISCSAVKRRIWYGKEFYGLLMAHFAVRGLMHEAALRADKDLARLSFLHAVRVVRRKMAAFGAIPPSGSKRVP
jgi:hypothetical protein